MIGGTRCDRAENELMDASDTGAAELEAESKDEVDEAVITAVLEAETAVRGEAVVEVVSNAGEEMEV